MTSPTPTSRPAPTEKTFRSYTAEQGSKYAQHRRDYHPNLYKTIIDQHASTGGQFTTILDVGCGPGTAARALAPHFTHAIGLDPSKGMIETARLHPGATSTSKPIRFDISTAEDLGSHLSPPIENHSIDLITASMAAHWFDMPRFWHRAARVLRPGGSVAIWATGDLTVHPSTPNATAIQASMDEIRNRDLEPYFEPGNLLTRSLYVDLPLPWTVEPPVPEFAEREFFRKEWGPGANDGEEFLVGGGLTVDLDTMEKVLGTASTVQRWREDHPDAVGTERDYLRVVRREIERLLHEAGVEKGKEVVRASLTGVLLMVKKEKEKMDYS